MSLEDNVMRFNKAAFELAQARVKSSPLDLTWNDFTQLGIVSKQLETEAIELKRLAQLALVPPVKTKSVEPAGPPDDHEALLKKHGAKPVTWKGLSRVLDDLHDTLIMAHKTQKGRIETLEQRNKDLEQRVLELEASIAARTVEHVER